jgi:hypothetical protein
MKGFAEELLTRHAQPAKAIQVNPTFNWRKQAFCLRAQSFASSSDTGRRCAGCVSASVNIALRRASALPLSFKYSYAICPSCI